MKTRKTNYCVLYTPVMRQARLKEVLREVVPEDRGQVFYPCIESWRRGSGIIEVKPMFPGYVFIRSDLGTKEIHEILKSNRWKLETYVKELGISEKIAAGQDVGVIFQDTTDLNEYESNFMDMIFGMDNEGEGLIRMSHGYKQRGEYHVMDGPLKGMERLIVNVNEHDRKAFLDFSINGKVARAGLEVKPKRYWYPNDKDAPELLNDGTEVDIKELIHEMMRDKTG